MYLDGALPDGSMIYAWYVRNCGSGWHEVLVFAQKKPNEQEYETYDEYGMLWKIRKNAGFDTEYYCSYDGDCVVLLSETRETIVEDAVKHLLDKLRSVRPNLFA